MNHHVLAPEPEAQARAAAAAASLNRLEDGATLAPPIPESVRGVLAEPDRKSVV